VSTNVEWFLMWQSLRIYKAPDIITSEWQICQLITNTEADRDFFPRIAYSFAMKWRYYPSNIDMWCWSWWLLRSCYCAHSFDAFQSKKEGSPRNETKLISKTIGHGLSLFWKDLRIFLWKRNRCCLSWQSNIRIR
jgi:hypothetical protein